MDLGGYLRAALSTPWEWGVHDCCAWPARWAQVPIPAYASEAEALAMIERAGGLVPLWQQHAAGYADEVAEAAAGDVGIIEAVNRERQVVETGAIFTGERWAFLLASGGIATAHVSALKVWRPRCLRS